MGKKLAQINVVCNGSTGKIMAEIQKEAEQNGYETISFYGRRKGYSNLKCKKIQGTFGLVWHAAITTTFNLHGHGSYFATKKLVKELKHFNPDVIYLHNIHGYYLNYKVLFNYLKSEYKGKIIWLLHDCWTFTGHCAHFDYIGCDKWKTQCYRCPQIKEYPMSVSIDTSKKEYIRKKKLFTGVKNLNIITPSEWLKKLVEKSFLGEYKVGVINNKVDLDLFKKSTDEKANNETMKKYGIPQNKKILLAVSSIWGRRKGYNTLINISSDLKDEVLVIVGVNKNQNSKLPENVIGIPRTDNQRELVILYSIADIFVNPTLEDNYPTVNLEAIACGTPVITNNTGGAPEMITETTGVVLKENTSSEMLRQIKLMIKKDFKNKVFNNTNIKNKGNNNIYF